MGTRDRGRAVSNPPRGMGQRHRLFSLQVLVRARMMGYDTDQMYYYLTVEGRAGVRQGLTSLIVTAVTVPVAAAVTCAILMILLVTLVGVPELEYALESVDDAATRATLASAQLLVLAYFISAACFGFSGKWAGMPICQLADRLYVKISGLVRLWSSSMSRVATPLRSPDEAYRPISYCGRPKSQRTSFLVGETPQLE